MVDFITYPEISYLYDEFMMVRYIFYYLFSFLYRRRSSLDHRYSSETVLSSVDYVETVLRGACCASVPRF